MQHRLDSYFMADGYPHPFLDFITKGIKGWHAKDNNRSTYKSTSEALHQYPEEETMLGPKDMLSNFICIYDNKTYQKGKIIQKVKWGMVYTGQISASEKAKPPPPKKNLLHCYRRAYLQFLTIIISLLLQNNDLCIFYIFFFHFHNLALILVAVVPSSYSLILQGTQKVETVWQIQCTYFIGSQTSRATNIGLKDSGLSAGCDLKKFSQLLYTVNMEIGVARAVDCGTEYTLSLKIHLIFLLLMLDMLSLPWFSWIHGCPSRNFIS